MTESLSVSEVAAATGYTRQAIHRAIRDGRLIRWLSRDGRGHARLAPEVVAVLRRGGVLRLRIDTRRPVAAAPPPAPPQPEGPPWGDVAGWCNALIDHAAFVVAPWSSTLWASLSDVLEMAWELATERGAYTPESLAEWEAEMEAGDE